MKTGIVTLALMFGGLSGAGAEEAKDKYTKIRHDWAVSKEYNPLFGVGDGRDEVVKLLADKKYKEFLAASEGYLKKVPIDIAMYSLRASACAATDDMQGYFQNKAAAWGLAASIASSGDGKSKDSAFKVVSTNEEYALLELSGLRSRKQELVDGRYDVLTVEIAGNAREIWFDVSKQLEFYMKASGRGP